MAIKSSLSFSQSSTITGRVTDSTGAGIENVSVKIKGTSIGTVTKADGGYSILAPASAKTIVFFKYWIYAGGNVAGR
jgi:hypothetical protein